MRAKASEKFRPLTDDNSPRLIRFNFTESILVVKTCVNWKGEVISTEFQENQSTTSDTTLINKAIRAAKVYKFEERQGSPIQCGNMTFKFKLKNK